MNDAFCAKNSPSFPAVNSTNQYVSLGAPMIALGPEFAVGTGNCLISLVIEEFPARDTRLILDEVVEAVEKPGKRVPDIVNNISKAAEAVREIRVVSSKYSP